MTNALNNQTLSDEAVQFLAAVMQARCNLLVSGDLLTDKSACLAFLESLIPEGRRVLNVETLEDHAASTAEDWIEQVREARPEHVFVSSWHAGNFLDVLRLIRASHGVVIGIHARDLRAGLGAIDLLAAQVAPTLPLGTVREHIVAGVAAGIHAKRSEDGSVSIERISETRGMEGDVIVLQDIFFLNDIEGKMTLRPTGIRPRLLLTLREQGIELPEAMFESELDRRLRRF